MSRTLLVSVLVPALAAAALLAPESAAQAPGWNGDSYALFASLASREIHLDVPSGPCRAAAERLAAARHLSLIHI